MLRSGSGSPKAFSNINAVVVSLQSLLGTPNFGVDTVCAVVRRYLAKEFPTEPAVLAWEPCESWCRWLLHHKCSFSYRVVTTKALSPAAIQRQNELFDILIRQVAALIYEHDIKPVAIQMSGEFGQYLFPQEKRIWAVTGSQHVEGVAEDKRQYSGNIVHNAMGQLVFGCMVFGRKTEKSMPSASIRDKYKNMLEFGYSPNHWFNLGLKKQLINRAVAAARASLQKLLGSEDRAKKEHLIHILDCWPVNISQEFKQWVHQEHPLLHVLYIPAGATGRFQINDTHLHRAFKRWMVSKTGRSCLDLRYFTSEVVEAQEWYAQRIGEHLQAVEDSKCTQAGNDRSTAQVDVSRSITRKVSRLDDHLPGKT